MATIPRSQGLRAASSVAGVGTVAITRQHTIASMAPETGSFTAEHIERWHEFVVEQPLAKAFLFFEPEGERAWAPGWDPVYVHPRDGAAGAGMVFTTDHGGEHTVWTMVRHEPHEGFVQYVRHTPGSRIGLVTVRCRPLGPERTGVHVTYELTALSEEGNAALRKLDEAAFRGFIESWGVAIAAAISGSGGR